MKIIDFLKFRYVDVVGVSDRNEFKPGAYIYVNPFNYLFLRKNPEILDVSYYRSDGIYLISIFKLFLPKSINFYRQSFDMTSLAPVIFEYCQYNKLSIFVAGGKPGDSDKFKNKVIDKYPDLLWKGHIDGYKSEDEIIAEALSSNADVVILGLGNIKQEQVAYRLASLKDGLYFTCGAFISQTANSKKLNYYPDWVNKYNLRWLYRFVTERHVIKRVVKYYPVFLFYFLIDLVRKK